MAAGSYPEYPDDLKASRWDKDKKSGFDLKSDVADRLKTLQKKSDAVDWKLFAEGWERSARTAADLDTEGAKRSKVFAGSVLPLKKDVLAVVAAAKAAEKKAAKELLATLKAIGKAADLYADAVDACGAALRQAIAKAEDALPEEDDAESAPDALVDPKSLLKQLTLCRKDPERRIRFAFVDAKDKQPPIMAVHLRMSARALFAKLQAASGVKAGTYGLAWVDDKTLMLQLDKPQPGIVKKVREPVKACGFHVAKVVLWDAEGQVFEQDEQVEQEAQAIAAEPTATATATPERGRVDQGVAFKARLGATLPGIQAALQSGAGQAAAIRAKFAQMGGLAKKLDFAGAQALLDEIDDLVASATPRAAPGAGAAPAAKDADVEQRAPSGTTPAPSLVVLQKARLVWDGLRKSVQSQFSTIQGAVVTAVRAHNADPAIEDEFDEGEITARLQSLFKTLDGMDKGLIDKLDEALGAEGAQRDARYAEASVLLQQFRSFAASDPTLAFIDDNGFATTDIRASVERALAELAEQI